MAIKHQFQVFYAEPVKEDWKSIKIELKETASHYQGFAFAVAICSVSILPAILGWGGFFLGLIGCFVLYLLDKDEMQNRLDAAKKTECDRRYQVALQKAIAEAQSCSDHLNRILDQSLHITQNVLPYFAFAAQKELETAQQDFAENAIPPFWDSIENTVKNLVYFNEAVEQLITNGEIYTKILQGRQSNFPTPYPVDTNISMPYTIITALGSMVRTAQTKFEFANIWEHRRTRKVLDEGFENLESAVRNISSNLTSTLEKLQKSLKDDFKNLQGVNADTLKEMEGGNKILTNTLQSIDKKLYYIQYNKQLVKGFRS
jgi:hypothetical protein